MAGETDRTRPVSCDDGTFTAAATTVASGSARANQPLTIPMPYAAEDLFHRWFEVPLRTLKTLPHGDGVFVALSTACFLWERYAVAILKEQELEVTEDTRRMRFVDDFAVDEGTARVFWNVIRNGLNHQGMPLQKREKHFAQWDFRSSYLVPVRLGESGGQPVLQVQPWLFVDRVLELWNSRLDLLQRSTSFPWGSVYGIFDGPRP